MGTEMALFNASSRRAKAQRNERPQGTLDKLSERDGDRRRDKFVNVGEFYANQNASGRNWIDLQPIRATKLETYTRQLQ